MTIARYVGSWRQAARWLLLFGLGCIGSVLVLSCITLLYMGFPLSRSIALRQLDQWHLWGERTMYAREASRLRNADAEGDAAAALKAGDTRFLAGGGFGLVVPGVPEGEYSKYELQPERLKLLYAGCEVHSDEEQRFRSAAYEYAARYNKVILAASGQ